VKEKREHGCGWDGKCDPIIYKMQSKVWRSRSCYIMLLHSEHIITSFMQLFAIFPRSLMQMPACEVLSHEHICSVGAT
jgi:hypothetical protein